MSESAEWLRKLFPQMPDNYNAHNGPHIRACDVANEIERLERERDEARKQYVILEQKYFIQQKAIEDAPHAVACRAFKPGYYGDCDCWKRDALEVTK